MVGSVTWKIKQRIYVMAFLVAKLCVSSYNVYIVLYFVLTEIIYNHPILEKAEQQERSGRAFLSWIVQFACRP